MWPIIPVVVKSIMSGVMGYFKKRSDRKRAKEKAVAKMQIAKMTADEKIELTDAECELVLARGLNESWKDEYLTIIITSPLLLIFVGSIYAAMTGDTRLMDGTNRALENIVRIGIDMGELMTIVVLAGVGLKFWRLNK